MKVKLILTLGLMTVLTACGGGGGGGGGGATPNTPTVPVTEYCADTNASNVSSALPCVCNSGYTVSTDGKTCDVDTSGGTTGGTGGTGGGAGTPSYTYSSSYSTYSPAQSATTPCSGTVATSRTMTCTRSDNTVVANSFCTADPNPTSTVASKSGSISVTPTNPSLTNGSEYKTCAVGSTTGTNAVTCNTSYHFEGSISTGNCYSNTRSCSPMPTGTTAGTQTWNSSSSNWNTCSATSCSAVSNYVLSGNSCVACGADQTVVNGVCTNTVVSEKLLFKNKMAMQILPTGTLKAWGMNEQGQLGIGSNTNQSSAQTVNVGTGRTTKRVYSTGVSTCAILDDNSVKCWGSNTNSQLGRSTVSTAANVPGALNFGGKLVKDIVVGGYSYCAIMTDNSVMCWGKNSYGELAQASGDVSTPTAISFASGRTVQKLVMSSSTTRGTSCAILDNGDLNCWGYNGQGQVGDGTNTDRFAVRSINLGTGLTAKNVYIFSDNSDSDYTSTCAILSNDSLKCWGYNPSGKLGVGDTSNKNSPTSVNVGTSRTVKSLYNNVNSAMCAILDNNTVSCWGKNDIGQVGDNSVTNRPSPTPVISGSVQEMILGNVNNNCALFTSGALSCWGSNSRGQVGVASSNSTIYQPTAVSLPSGKTVKKVVNTADYEMCVILSDNSVQCTGDNTYGTVGSGTASTYVTSLQSVTLPSSTTTTELKLDYYGACALLSNDTVSCWGYNEKYKLGVGTNVYYMTPQSVVYAP